MPTPFHGKEFTFTQPDGSRLRVRGFGNQFQARFETLDGQPVALDPETGFYQPAAESAVAAGVDADAVQRRRLSEVRSGLPRGTTRWEQRREEKKQASAVDLEAAVAAPPQTETAGQFLGLCLLVEFPKASPTIRQAEVEAFCNQPGYNGFGNNGSVRDYFLDNSAHQLDYTNRVAPYYLARHRKAHYTAPTVRWPDRAIELVVEALEHHKAAGFDFRGLTTDDKGFLRALNVFYVGQPDSAFEKGLWPHAFSLPAPIELLPGMFAKDYQISDLGDELSLGTFCHENGHMICDFPDLYDLRNQSVGTGNFCLMGYGATADEKNPPQICAYLKRLAGWTENLITITRGESVTLAAGRNEFALYEKNSKRRSTEYFILEHRRQAGRDQALPGAGLAIWHVDEKGSNEHEQMSPVFHYECSLEQADGRFELEGQSVERGDGDDLFPFRRNDQFGRDTTPSSRWWDGTPSGLEIRNIRVNGDSVTFETRRSS